MNRGIFEGADYFLDMEMSIRNKKRRRGEALSAEYGKMDEDYASFLEGLQEFWEAKFVEEGDDDPTYMEFLKNLKEHGSAYMCKVSKENGVLFPIMYEVEIDSPNEIKRKTPRSRSGTCICDKRNLYQDGDMKSSRKNSSAENDSSDVLRRSLCVANDLKSGLKNSGSKSDHHDGIKKKTPRSRRGDRVMENRRLHVGSNQKISDSKNYHHDGIKRTLRSSTGDRVRENRSLDVDSDQKNSDSGIDHPDELKWKTPHSYKGDHVRKKMSIVVDETYEQFLKNLHVSEESVFYENGDQERIFYEPCDQQTSDVEIEPLEKDTRPLSSTLRPSTPIPGPQTPSSRTKTTTQKKPIPTDGHITLSVSNKTCKNREKSRRSSSFWRKTELHDYLRKPFTQKEYNELREQLCTRKPVQIHRESRSGGTDRPGHMGKSYVDIYPDLKEEIKNSKSDKPKVLNLLRMCKFYVQKIPSIPDGTPKPWQNDLTKTILPGSS